MKKVAIYPGSFNPLHEGHIDVIEKTLRVFDKVIVARGINPDKEFNLKQDNERFAEYVSSVLFDNLPHHKHHIISKVTGFVFQGLFKDFIDLIKQPNVIIKGLRNGRDLEYEKDQQYWNEDLGIEIPTFYIIADRKLAHISSSAIKSIEKFKEQI